MIRDFSPPFDHPVLDHHDWILRARRLEDLICSWYRQGRITGGVYRGTGQEAIAAACGMALGPRDLYAPLIRDCAGRLAKGISPQEIARSYLGKITGKMRGRDGNVHHGDLDLGVLPMISHLGAMIPTITGMLLARRLQDAQTTDVGIAMIGDGGMATGALHEGLNAAAVQRLPLVVVVVNNGFSYSTANEHSFACEDLADRAEGYGVGLQTIDGDDPSDCRRGINAAVSAARTGHGAQMVVATTLRRCGHGEHDDAAYIPESLRAQYRDCLDASAEQVLHHQADCNLEAWDAAVKADLERTCAPIFDEPDASPEAESWCVYASEASI